jgi:hypothetical protein
MLAFTILLIGHARAFESTCLNSLSLFVQTEEVKLPDLVFENSNAQLLDSIKSIIKVNENKFDLIKTIPQINSELMLIGGKLSDGFKKFYPNLSSEITNEFSLRLQKILCDELGISWADHAKHLADNLFPYELNSKLFISIPEILSKQVKIWL